MMSARRAFGTSKLSGHRIAIRTSAHVRCRVLSFGECALLFGEFALLFVEFATAEVAAAAL